MTSPLEPPQDQRIFNRRQQDGTYRPLAKFFDPEDRTMTSLDRTVDSSLGQTVDLNALIHDAARAEELIPLDELEDWADESRAYDRWRREHPGGCVKCLGSGYLPPTFWEPGEVCGCLDSGHCPNCGTVLVWNDWTDNFIACQHCGWLDL